MFLAVAEAEDRVHGSTVEKIHFHEVGAIDSIVDIVGVAVAFDLLGIDRVVCNAIPTGRGFVKIDHGICPVPAPGTAEILKGIPLADIPIEAELTTPTGAAIVKTLADSFGSMPAMTIEAIGCGCGTKTFPERANVLRVFIGNASVAADTEHVVMLETNLDDVPGETIGHVRERLQSAGALDVFVTPIQMKKDRPGVLLSVLCRPDMVTRCEDIMFTETGTLGIRRLQIQRSVQQRDIVEVATPWGKVKGKRAWRTGLQPTFSPEFEDCARLSRETGVTLRDIYRAAESAFAKGRSKEPLGTIIAPPRVTIREKIDMIAKIMKDAQRSTFSALVNDGASRLEIVVTFLAMLELIKRYHIDARQEGLFSDIEINRNEDWKDDEELELEFE